ncbi:MAG: UDP-glucuronic acid decarboxylase family protein [Polyangiales bacterium]
MRCLVTGGTGFVGSHLCERLLADGHHVVALDNFYTGPARNVEHMVQGERFELVEHDVNSPFPRLDPLDRIYHLACPASPPHYQRDPVFTLTTNVYGTHNALQLAERHGARFLQASTSEVYGDPEVHPQTESYRGNVSTLGARACYDEGKRAAEALCMDFRRSRGVEVRIARIFNTYGPRMELNDGRVVGNFLVQGVRGEPLTVYGDGKHTRSFCFVDDLVDGLVRLMEQPETGPFNLGNPSELSILELAERVREVTGGDSAIELRPLPEDDPRVRCPDIGAARAAFGFEPRVTLVDGLRRTAEDFRRRLGFGAEARS